MKTADLCALLAGGAVAADTNATRGRYAAALGCGALGAALLMTIGLGVRPDLAAAAHLPMFWVKLAFPAVLLASTLSAVLRLSRPGMQLGRVLPAIAAPVVVMWIVAVAMLLFATPAARGELLFGMSWSVCPLYIATLSAPAFVALLWAMKGMAPTRPMMAGGACGLLAGALGALVYALHCPEMAAPFIAIWYLLGMLIPSAVGAVIGPRLLRF